MAIEPISLGDFSARAKMNAAIGKANLVDGKADTSLVEALLTKLPISAPVQHRPGDAPFEFGQSLASGERDAVAPIPESIVRYDDAGRVVRLAGDGICAPRQLYALEPGRRYKVTFVVQRRVNSPDPDNDAIRCALAWYNQAKGALVSPASTTIEDLVGITTGTGRITVQAVVARAPSGDVDIVSPASARYCRPYVQTFGTFVQNDVEVIGWDDITDVVAFAPDVSALQAEIDALTSLDLGDRVSVLEGFSTSPNFFRVETIGALAAANVPVSVDVVEVLGYYAVGDGGDHKRVRVGSSTATTQTDAGGAHWEIVGDVLDVRAFGARGNATDTDLSGTDDAAAIQKALDWLVAAPGSSVLTFSKGRYRIGSPCAANFDAKPTPASILMIGSIKPDPGIGRAITISNPRDGRFNLRVYGGGQIADYSVANPVGGDEAFRFVNAYGVHIENVEGAAYRGRMLRITDGPLGVFGRPSQLITIDRIHADSSAAVTASEAERMAKGVGQSFFIDTRISAFGTIKQAYLFFETYGPVVEDTYDVTLSDIETLFRGTSGLELRGVISLWGGIWKLGSELAVSPPTLLKIIPGAQDPQQVSIDTVFCVGGQDGIYAEDCGYTVGQGLAIRSINTRLNLGNGVHLKNCKKFSLGQVQGWRDRNNLRLSGACASGEITMSASESKRQSIIVESAVLGDIVFSGTSQNGNTDGAANTALVDVATTGTVDFVDFRASSGQVDYLYKLPSGNNVRFSGGRVETAGGTAKFNIEPRRCEDVRDWVVENRGVATILAGQTFVFVTHGLDRAPDHVLLTLSASAGPSICWSTPGSTTFAITTPTPVGANQQVDWRAWLNYAG